MRETSLTVRKILLPRLKRKRTIANPSQTPRPTSKVTLPPTKPLRKLCQVTPARMSIQKKRTNTFNDQYMNQKTALTGSEGISHFGSSLRLRLLLLTPAHPFSVFLFILAHFATNTLDRCNFGWASFFCRDETEKT